MDEHEQYLQVLIGDEPAPDDRAWKVAAGHIIAATWQQARKTNGRVTRLERVVFGSGLLGLGIAVGLGVISLESVVRGLLP